MPKSMSIQGWTKCIWISGAVTQKDKNLRQEGTSKKKYRFCEEIFTVKILYFHDFLERK